jgi:predicted O-methyltransferase YrrM
MAMEITVITSDISGIGELIINRENGLLVPERDASALAAAICELIDDANLRERLAKAGRKKIISDFNVKIEAKKLSLVLSETVMRKTKIQEIKTRCDGMMPREVYAQIYSCACAAQPGNMLELGAAHGAASVCLAKGIRDSAKPATLLTVEKGEGKNSSIEKWGPKEVNIAKLRNNLIYFDCQSIVTVFPNRLKEVVTQLKNSGPFSLLLIDADGFIDRDFLLFYNLLKPGADIIIDDYINFKDVASKSQSNPLGKGYATYIFVNYFLDKKLIRKDKIIEGTIFCKKPEEIIEPVKFDEDELIRIRTEILAEAKRILSPS